MHDSNAALSDTVLVGYLRMLAGANKSTETITAYRTDLSYFLTYLPQKTYTIAAAADATRAGVEEFLAFLARQGLRGTTQARKLAATREFSAT